MLLHTDGLSKAFGKKVVLDQFSIKIDCAEIVGLIGPNGSGKTTLLNILMGIVKPTIGTFQINPDCSVGMSVSRKGFFQDMTVKDNIVMYTKLAKANALNIQKMLERFDVDFGDQRFGNLSAGQKQKVSLVMAFMNSYNFILLDEPTNHLDIDAVISLRELIFELHRESVSFIITSHHLSDLEKVCTRILFLKNGRIAQDSSQAHLIALHDTLEQAYLSVFK